MCSSSCSPPMQKNLLPAPVSTTTPTSEVSRAIRSASRSSRAVWKRSLLALSGRLMVMVETPSTTSTTMSW